MCTGAPCTAGKREVIWMARMASAGLNGAHRHDERAVEAARPPGRHVGLVHGHGGAAFDVLQAQAGLEQRLLEGERAAEYEGHEVFAPPAHHILRLVHAAAVLEHAVARHIGAYVEALGEHRQRGVARLRDAEQRAGLGIELAEAQEVAGELARQDGDVALHMRGRHAARRAAPLAGADARPGAC
jgi:hypothetical protein